jgi:hypothetical protein
MTSLLDRLNKLNGVKGSAVNAPAPQPATTATPAAVPVQPASKPVTTTAPEPAASPKGLAFAALAASTRTATPSTSLADAKSGLAASLGRVSFSGPLASKPRTGSENVQQEVNKSNSVGTAPVSTGVRRDFRWTRQVDAAEQQVVDNFIDQLTVLENSLTHKTMVADALKSTLLYMKEYPFLTELLYPEDAVIMVRALRASRDVVIVKKEERSAKGEKRRADMAEVAELLGSGLDFGMKDL